MDTIFIQPIFAPDQKRFERNWNSLTSFLNYCEENKLDVKFALGGWCKDEYWDKFVNLINTNYAKNKITLIRCDRNYGKAVTVNLLYSKVKEKNVDFKYILTCDSDILFPKETKNLIHRLEQLPVQSHKHTKKPFGMVSLNQLGANCHWKVCYQNEYTYTNTFGNVEKIVYPTAPSGIAGGCLFINKECWEKVGGYRQMGLYSGDDAWFLVDTYQSGFSHQMADSIGIVHPEENDEEYAKWKHKVCQRDSVGGIRKANIDHIIKEADEFWKNRA
jgi:glycosyltransferase involved in cell wall biosynthesis